MRACKCGAPLDYASDDVVSCWGCRATATAPVARAGRSVITGVDRMPGGIGTQTITAPTHYGCYGCKQLFALPAPYRGGMTANLLGDPFCAACGISPMWVTVPTAAPKAVSGTQCDFCGTFVTGPAAFHFSSVIHGHNYTMEFCAGCGPQIPGTTPGPFVPVVTA